MSKVSKTTASPIDDLKRRIRAEQTALERVEARLVELEEELRSALLAEDDAPLAVVETTIATTKRQKARHGARLELFFAELEALEEKQRHQEALADFQRAAVQIAEAAAWLMNRYGPLAAEMAAGLATLKAADQLAERTNRQLPAGCAPLRPPSQARHVPREPDRREIKTRTLWVSATGYELRGIQFDADGRPNVPGARLVQREEEAVVSGRTPWFPLPIYEEVVLPALERDKPDFWRP